MSLIWLNKKQFTKYQKTITWNSVFSHPECMYSAVEIKKEYKFDKEIKNISFKYASHNTCNIRFNNKLVAFDSIKPAMDFHQKRHYCNELFWGIDKVEVKETKDLCINVMVQTQPWKTYDFGTGKAAFTLEAIITFIDGSSQNIETDNSWDIRVDERFTSPNDFDGTKTLKDFSKAEIKDYDWKIADPCIDAVETKELIIDKQFITPKKSKHTFKYEFSIIYSAYVGIEAKCDGLVEGELTFFETKGKTSATRHLKFDKNTSFQFFDMESVGGFTLKVNNLSDNEAEIVVHIYQSYYPYKEIKQIVTSNERLNDLFAKCAFAVKNCSQNCLLDSPKHLEPLASCAGDYQIESLVIAFATGNYDLIKHVLRGYAKCSYENDGISANHSYSLVFVSWLYKIYMLTGDKQLIEDCLPGVLKVCKKYGEFVGKTGLIDAPYTYCFIDWLIVDGVNLFCPSKNLGQSVVNMFYYEALRCTSLIANELGQDKLSSNFKRKANKIKKAINTYLYDKDRGLYIEGIADNEPESNRGPLQWKGVPANTTKKYYRKHANALAVAFDIAKRGNKKKIINKIFTELKDCEMQPYFTFFLMQGIREANLDKKYAMKAIKEWLKFVKPKDKGLPEGFYKPDPNYEFDYSHAWACSPYYTYIAAASGIKVIEPGMKKISLNLKDLGLKSYEYNIGTPFGFINVKKNQGEKAVVKAPKEIEII